MAVWISFACFPCQRRLAILPSSAVAFMKVVSKQYHFSGFVFFLSFPTFLSARFRFERSQSWERSRCFLT